MLFFDKETGNNIIVYHIDGRGNITQVSKERAKELISIREENEKYRIADEREAAQKLGMGIEGEDIDLDIGEDEDTDIDDEDAEDEEENLKKQPKRTEGKNRTLKKKMLRKKKMIYYKENKLLLKELFMTQNSRKE